MVLLRRHWRFILFGFLTAFATHIGQTFFFSLFNSGIRADFGLSNESFGLIYMLATLSSGLLVARLGEAIDRVDLRWWASGLALTLGAAALLFALTRSLLLLGLAIFLLRLTGQGLLTHTVSTSMARYFERFRGRALALAGFGFPASEALLPMVATVLLLGLHLSWHQAWLLLAGATLSLYLPAIWLLLGRSRLFGEVADAAARQASDPASSAVGASRPDLPHPAAADPLLEGPLLEGPLLEGLTRAQVLRGKTFWLLIPIIFTPSFVNTGWIFHHQTIATLQSWPVGLFATAFAGMAFCSVLSNLLWGSLVDRWSAKALIWAPMVFLLASQACLALPGNAFAGKGAQVLLGFALLGIMQGGLNTVGAAVWAELFGRLHLGAIRALASAVMILGSAGAPFVMGWMLDSGWPVSALSTLCLSLGLFACACALVIHIRLAPLARQHQL